RFRTVAATVAGRRRRLRERNGGVPTKEAKSTRDQRADQALPCHRYSPSILRAKPTPTDRPGQGAVCDHLCSAKCLETAEFRRSAVPGLLDEFAGRYAGKENIGRRCRPDGIHQR